ncbi:MAG: DUF6568 family protein [Bacilli bacterium]
MKKEKNISLKNYIILAVVLILSIILVIYFYMWYNAYEESKLNTMIMDKYLQVINYNELNNYLVENKDAVIYSSVLEDQKIRDFEKKFKNIIIKNSLNNDILYLDLTEELKNKNITKDIKETYNINGQDITNTPSIMIFKDGQLYSIYNIKEKNYNINHLINYLEEEDIIDD